MSLHTAADLATELRCTTRKVTKEATRLGIGINLGGRAGYRFTDEDKQRLLDSMRPSAPVSPRRKRRAA